MISVQPVSALPASGEPARVSGESAKPSAPVQLPALADAWPAIRWCVRMLAGLRCRWRLDRRDASLMVHMFDDRGEMIGAIEACKKAVVCDPQNVYTYVHMIDLAARHFGDLGRADRYWLLGLEILLSARDRELLTAFHLYTHTLTRRRL